jgi:copper resistance protein B
MNRSLTFPSAIVLALSAGLAQGAEDPSVHQEHAAPQADEHSQHQPDADQHAQHGTDVRNEPTASEAQHVPPDPPQHPMHDMSNEEMTELMGMDDTAAVGMVLLDQLEWRQIDKQDALFWDGQAWYGNDYNKAWFKSEGERVDGSSAARTELLWDRVFSRWWDVQAGVRHDFGEGPSRTWAAFGVQGLAPYWFEVEATAYVGEEGRTAARFSGEYELLITQRLILQPKIEFDLYGKGDPQNGIGPGLASTDIDLRLRYEFRREFAPYVGVVWTRSYGETADLARAAGHEVNDLQVVAGLRLWFYPLQIVTTRRQIAV